VDQECGGADGSANLRVVKQISHRPGTSHSGKA
jgi:hypothetical protein